MVEQVFEDLGTDQVRLEGDLGRGEGALGDLLEAVPLLGRDLLREGQHRLGPERARRARQHSQDQQAYEERSEPHPA
jgi:hypothetical protein